MDRLHETSEALPTVYFLYATGCPACEAAKPEIGAWYARNKDRARVVPVDLTRVEWKAKAWEPGVTPTFVIRFPDGRLSRPLEGYEPGQFAEWAESFLP